MVAWRGRYKDFYEAGRDAGYDAAMNTSDETADEDEWIDLAAEAEDSARQYSPFEFLAAEINKSRDPDKGWDAYEEGVMDGIDEVVRGTTQEQTQ